MCRDNKKYQNLEDDCPHEWEFVIAARSYKYFKCPLCGKMKKEEIKWDNRA
jgi:hypothetical protein